MYKVYSMYLKNEILSACLYKIIFIPQVQNDISQNFIVSFGSSFEYLITFPLIKIKLNKVIYSQKTYPMTGLVVSFKLKTAERLVY